MANMFFNGWFALARTAVIGVLSYAALIVFLRVSGKRTLGKMNAFDLVITVSLGSTLATIVLDADVPLARGLLALALLVALQFTITWSSVRWQWLRGVVTGEPTLLFHQGQYRHGTLRRTRVTEAEVRAAVRAAGHPEIDEIEAVVLETDGSFSVVRKTGGAASSLAGVQR